MSLSWTYVGDLFKSYARTRVLAPKFESPWDSEATPDVSRACFRVTALAQSVCLLQLDVEGHERAALIGGRETIQRDKPIILIEDNSQDSAPVLRDLGYRRAFQRDGLHYWSLPSDLKFVKSLNQAS